MSEHLQPEPRSAPSTGADAGVAIRGGATRVVGYGAGLVMSLGTATILVRHLGIAGFGRYITVTSLMGIVGGLTEAGIYLFGIREFAGRDELGRRALLSNLLGLRLSLTLAGVVLAVLFALVAGYPDALVVGVPVAGAALLFQVAADVLSIPLQADLRLGRLTLVDLARRLTALVLVAAVAALGAGLVPLLAVSVASGAGAVVLLLAMLPRMLRVRIELRSSAWRPLLAAALPYAVAQSIGAIYLYVTVIVMSLIASAVQTGLFATSFRVMQVALTVPVLLLTAVFPLISSRRAVDNGELGPMMRKVLGVAVICGAWMSLSVALGASFVVDVVAGAKGHAAAPVLRIQGLVLALSFISTSSALGLISLRRFRPLIAVSSCALAMNVVLDLILIHHNGARGGALADVLTELIVAIAMTGTLLRGLRGAKFDTGVLLHVVLALVPGAATLLLPIGSVPRVAIASVGYFAILLALGGLPDEIVGLRRRLAP